MSKKIRLDKYYTPIDIAKYCIDKTFEVIGKDNISEIIEPSAGSGSFSNQLECIAYDIEPEGEGIIKQDYLQLDLKYKSGRLVIGNPPFGRVNNLSVAFCNKSFEIAEYVSFILPISQYNNTNSIYKYDLIHSEKLDIVNYEGIDVPTCLNIYKRPVNGMNKKHKPVSSVIDIGGYRFSNIPNRMCHVDESKYDFGICGFGTIGKEVQRYGQYCDIKYIKVKNPMLKDKVKDFILNVDWKTKYNQTKSPSISIWQLIETVEEKFGNDNSLF